MSKEFVRQESFRHKRLGKNKWRKPKGRDSKMRLKRKSQPTSPTVGHKSPKKALGKIKGLNPILVHNIAEIEKVGKDSIAILAKVGAKKKLEIIKHAEEKKIKILNLGGKNEIGK